MIVAATNHKARYTLRLRVHLAQVSNAAQAATKRNNPKYMLFSSTPTIPQNRCGFKGSPLRTFLLVHPVDSATFQAARKPLRSGRCWCRFRTLDLSCYRFQISRNNHLRLILRALVPGPTLAPTTPTGNCRTHPRIPAFLARTFPRLRFFNHGTIVPLTGTSVPTPRNRHIRACL